MRGLALALLFAALGCAARPLDVSLGAAQLEALRVETQHFAPEAKPGTRNAFRVSEANLSGAIVYGPFEERPPARERGLRQLCRAATITLDQPMPGAFKSEACVDMNSKSGMEPYFWRIAPFAPIQ
jgi:hypothetical protein